MMTVEDGKEGQQGVARYCVGPDGTSCEFAIVVSDARRNQGIATRLMSSLISSAPHQGLKTIEGDVLGDNHAMLRLMKNLDFTVQRPPDDPSTVRVWRSP